MRIILPDPKGSGVDLGKVEEKVAHEMNSGNSVPKEC